MRAKNSMSDAQAEAGARNLILYRGTSIKPIKDPDLFVPGDAFAMIGDLQRYCTIGVKCMNSDGRSQRGILQRIIENLFDR